MNAITKLHELLTVANIPHEVSYDGINAHLCYPRGKEHITKRGVELRTTDETVCSAICGKYSYGGLDNLIEIMGLLTDEEAEGDEVVGFLLPEEVFARIAAHYYGEKWKGF
jgi:hypothetical protein